MNQKIFIPTLFAVATASWLSAAENAPSPKEDRRVTAATTGEDVGISGRDGITVSGADVMVTRNGRTEKLDAPLTLDGGTRINPDGTVKLADGREVKLLAEQRLTFDGRLLNSPIPPNTPVVPAPVATVTVPAGGSGTVGVTGATGQGTVGAPGNARGDGTVTNVVPGTFVDPGLSVGTTAVVDPFNGQPVNFTTDPRTGARSFTTIDPATGRRVTGTLNATTGQIVLRDTVSGKLIDRPGLNTGTGTTGTTGTTTGTPTGATTGTTGTTTINGRATNGTGTTTGPTTGTRSGTGTTRGTTGGTRGTSSGGAATGAGGGTPR